MSNNPAAEHPAQSDKPPTAQSAMAVEDLTSPNAPSAPPSPTTSDSDTARPTLDGTTLASSAYSRSESNFSDLTEVPWDVGLRRALHRLAMMRSNSYPPLPAPIPMAEERPSPGASSVWYSTNDGGPVFATFDEDGHPIRPETPTERPFIRPSLPSPWGSRPASRESSTERRGATTYCPFEMEEDWLEGGTGFTVPTPPRQIPENLYPVRRPRQEI